MKIALVGQPNSGKSTIFNWVAGYKSATSNFPGTTVTYTGSKVRLNGAVAEIVDLPGIYSLAAVDAAAEAALDFLIRREVDVIVNVIDASRAVRGLELTLQLLELGRPLVVCLNMMDEAARAGVHLDIEKLSASLGVPVIATIAAKGEGVSRVFQEVREVVRNKIVPNEIPVSAPVAKAVLILSNRLNGAAAKQPIPTRLLCLKVLENNATFVEVARQHAPALLVEAPRQRAELENIFGRSAPEVISSERHANARRIFEQVAAIGKPYFGWRDKIDQILMHKYWGYFFLALILFVSFNLIFSIGAALEPHLLAWFETGVAQLQTGLVKLHFGFDAKRRGARTKRRRRDRFSVPRAVLAHYGRAGRSRLFAARCFSWTRSCTVSVCTALRFCQRFSIMAAACRR
jgi:ferrous iron transport protein B